MVRNEEIARLLAELKEEFDEDVHNLDRLRTTIGQLGGQASLGPYSALLLALTGMRVEEQEAVLHWRAIRRRRSDMAAQLNRAVGLRTALIDYWTEQNRRALSPLMLQVKLSAGPSHRRDIDPLTGLLTAEALMAHLQREVQRAKRFQTGFSYLVAELDDYADLVDQIGECNGDLVQQEVGLLLKNMVRDIDPAARVGAGRFAVVLPESDRSGAFLAADRLRRRVREHFADRSFGGLRATVTLSGGVSCYPEDAAFGVELMRLAAQTLHLARSRGNDRVSVHHRDRREYIRLNVDPALLRIEVLEHGHPVAGERSEQRLRNISPQGVLLESDRSFEVGHEVNVICNNLREIDQVILPARVMRVERLDDTSRYEIGLAFDLAWEHQVLEILEFLDRFRSLGE